MRRFIIRRALQSILLLWAVMSLSWLLIATAPGGPEAFLVENPRVTAEQREAIRASFGLNKPLYEQYATWMARIVTLDFGRSYTNPLPAMQLIGERVWPTMQLGFFSYVIGMLGIPIGIYAARHRGKLGDNVVRVLTVIGSAMPAWWLALMVIIILANTIKWFPQGEGKDGFGAWFLHLLIPALLLSSGTLIAFTRFVRAETLEVLAQDYVRTAEAKGLSVKQVSRWHIFRNSLIPVVTLLGFFLPTLLSGAIITETIFNWPGMGRLFFQAANGRDMPVLLGILFFTTILTIVGTFLADIGYALVDPRVRYN
jgi:peptide/nickel transport system permease protein